MSRLWTACSFYTSDATCFPLPCPERRRHSERDCPSIDAFDVPFCDAFLHRQRSEQSAPGFWTPLLRILSEAEGFAGLVAIAIAFLFLGCAFTRLSAFPLVLASVPLTVGFLAAAVHLEEKPAHELTSLRAWISQSILRLSLRFPSSPTGGHSSLEAHSAAATRQRESSRTNLVVGAIVVAFLLWSLLRESLSEYVMPSLIP
jgi:hypothetical protein